MAFMKKDIITVFFILLALMLVIGSCSTTNEEPTPNAGQISFSFEHRVDTELLRTDELIYENEAGNRYMVNEIQYYISDVTLYQDRDSIILNAWSDIHYVDTDISSTREHLFPDKIPAGVYDRISFTFGLNAQKNQSLIFVNPPESLMFWPELLGGGYHYMKLNGKWRDTLDRLTPFNFHLGIGQIYHSFPDSISAYVHNDFRVDLPDSRIEILGGENKDITLVMNIENWFKSPYIYDHNHWGGDIMQKQDAMKMACENGRDVFTVEIQ
jgi:hypothetical protein